MSLFLESHFRSLTFYGTAQKMKFSIKDFFSKYDQLKESLKENLIFCAVWVTWIASSNIRIFEDQ